MDDHELEQDPTTRGWRRNGEELKNTRIFGLDAPVEFPSAFQTYRPDQARSFPFQIGKRVAKKTEESEELRAEEQKSKAACAAFYNSEKTEHEYLYTERTPTATPQPELVATGEEVKRD